MGVWLLHHRQQRGRGLNGDPLTVCGSTSEPLELLWGAKESRVVLPQHRIRSHDAMTRQRPARPSNGDQTHTSTNPHSTEKEESPPKTPLSHCPHCYTVTAFASLGYPFNAPCIRRKAKAVVSVSQNPNIATSISGPLSAGSPCS